MHAHTHVQGVSHRHYHTFAITDRVHQQRWAFVRILRLVVSLMSGRLMSAVSPDVILCG